MAGYKRTEVGVVPEDWELEFVENLAHLSTGGRNTQDHVDDGQYPFFVRSQTVERINSYSFDGEAVLTAGDGVGTGKVFHYVNGKFDMHQRVYRISDFSSRINGYFFYLYFSGHFYGRIMQMTAKSSVDSVRREMIARMLIPFPPTLAEQEAIAGVLSDADTLIESLEQLLTKKRQIKKGSMQELLTGKTRLLGFSGEWEVIRLGDESDLITKGTTPTSLGRNFIKQGINFVKVESLTEDGTILPEMLAAVDEETHHLLKRSQLRKNDILFSIAGALGRTAIVNAALLPANTNQALAIIRLKPQSCLRHSFILKYLSGPQILTYITAINVQAAQANLSLEDIRSFEVPAPSAAEQTAIGTILSDMDAEIAALEAKLSKARQLKQGMMQELLTGRIRLI